MTKVQYQNNVVFRAAPGSKLEFYPNTATKNLNSSNQYYIVFIAAL